MTSSEVVKNFGPFLSWAILPNLATKLVLKFLYSNRILTLPSSPDQVDLHKKVVRTFVIISYLLYTIFAVIFQRPDNFYELLAIDINSETEIIRKSFRKLAMIYHPDKNGGGMKNEKFFISLRRAHDCLADPVKRMAYDRFGESILDWKEAITMKDYYTQGLQNSLLFYVINPVVFGFIHWMNAERIMTYWHFSLLVSLFSSELALIVNSSFPQIFGFPPRTTQHDLISALHATYIAITLASGHLSNLLPEPKGESAKWQNRSFDKDINEMREDIEGFRLAMRRMDNHWRGLTSESERALSYSLLPLRSTMQASVQTRGEAAASISTGNQRKIRRPNAMEETYIHLLSRLIFRARVNAIPGMLQSLPSKTAMTEIVSQKSSTDTTNDNLTTHDTNETESNVQLTSS